MRARWAAVGLGCVALASAAEPPASGKTAPPPAPDEDTISAARRDLEAIRALRGPGAESTRGELLRLAAPELSLAPAAPVATPHRPANGTLPKGANGAGGTNANWLVDAMARKVERHPGEAAGDGPATALDERTADNPLAAAAKPRRGPGQERDPTHREASGTAPTANAATNPLSAYMGAWMTPQDYQLLRPGSPAGAPRGAATDRMVAFLPEGAGTALAPERGLPVSSHGSPPGSAPRENPFLAALGPVAPAATANQSPLPLVAAPAATSRPPAVALPPPATTAAAPSILPALVKAPDDAKYFKPLKKF